MPCNTGPATTAPGVALTRSGPRGGGVLVSDTAPDDTVEVAEELLVLMWELGSVFMPSVFVSFRIANNH